MELYDGIIFMKRILGMPRTSTEPPWDPRDPLGTLLGALRTPLGPQGTPLGPPRDVPGTPGHAPEPPGTPLRRPRDAPGTPGNHWEPPGTPYGSQKKSYLNKYTTPEALDCCVRNCLLGPIA